MHIIHINFLFSAYVSGGGSTSGVAKGLSVRTSYNLSVAMTTSKEAELGQTDPVVGITGKLEWLQLHLCLKETKTLASSYFYCKVCT